MKLTAAQRLATQRWTKSQADVLAVGNGCWFDTQAAAHVVEFFERFLHHSKGEWAGQPFVLLKWQRDEVIKPLFGWKRADGTRRYRTAYIEIPKKNGKSSLCSGLSLYGLLADGEPGAEVYAGAASRDQATIVYREAANMVKASRALSKAVVLTESTKHMAHPASKSIYKALSADAGTNEGLNIHFLIMDEMHAQPNDLFWNALMYGGATRRQPLKLIITTAGVDQDSICHEYHTIAKSLLTGLTQDDSFFAYIRSAEWAMERDPAHRESAWRQPKVWSEANPSLGATISLASFKEDFTQAANNPRLENAFKRYRLNIWTEQDERWLDMQRWDACAGALDMESLEGQPCYAGLDLATTSDLCAFVLYFPTCQHATLPYFWLPRETANLLYEKGDASYFNWGRQGLLTLTDGNVTDYDQIRADINALKAHYDIRKIAVDRWNAAQIMTQLQGDGFDIVQFGQGYASMSAPAKELERLVTAGELLHSHHPILTWNARNVAIEQDAAGNIKPSKAKSSKKIDGIVALVMAIGLGITEPLPQGSVYESRGILVF